MKKWNNLCPKCNSKNIREDGVDVYYSRNPSRFYCEDCKATIIAERVLVIKKVEYKYSKGAS